jgi:hypothetical protein
MFQEGIATPNSAQKGINPSLNHTTSAHNIEA